MSLGLIADDLGRRHHLPAPIHHLIRTRTEKQNKKETNISVDAYYTKSPEFCDRRERDGL